jgi:hypothetical protein
MIAGKYKLFFSFFHPYLDSHIKALMPLRVKLNRYHEQAERTAAGFVERLQEMALAMPQMCCALYLQALAHPRQVTCQSVCSDKSVFLTPFVSQEKNHDVAHSAAFACTPSTQYCHGLWHSASREYVCTQACVLSCVSNVC